MSLSFFSLLPLPFSSLFVFPFVWLPFSVAKLLVPPSIEFTSDAGYFSLFLSLFSPQFTERRLVDSSFRTTVYGI